MSKINKIRLSGTDYDIQDVSATSVVEVTQQQYDDLPASAKTDNILYIITDSTVDYVTSAQTQSAITQAVSGKQDTLVSSVNIKTINNESILGSGNIDIQGGGSSYTAGDGIDITNDVISVTGKVSTSDFNTFSGSVESRLSEDEEVTAAGLNALNDKIDSISGANAIEVTQAEYDALVTGGTVDPNAFYIITDATEVDISQYWTSAQTNSAITQAVSGKQDTLVSSVNIKTINNESLLGSGNIDIQGGGGKAIEAGTNISITTGETADTINCTLPIRTDGSYSGKGLILGNGTNMGAKGASSIVGGDRASATTNANFSFVVGSWVNASNEKEFVCGSYNITRRASSTFGNSGNTLFSVGNGTAYNARHNAFEIRQNGDIYITSGGTDIKLQDNLGSTIEISSAITSGDTNPVQGGVLYDKFDEIEEVTAAALNTLSENFDGLKLKKVTQAQYDALSGNTDSNTLYVIVN